VVTQRLQWQVSHSSAAPAAVNKPPQHRPCAPRGKAASCGSGTASCPWGCILLGSCKSPAGHRTHSHGGGGGAQRLPDAQVCKHRHTASIATLRASPHCEHRHTASIATMRASPHCEHRHSAGRAARERGLRERVTVGAVVADWRSWTAGGRWIAVGKRWPGEVGVWAAVDGWRCMGGGGWVAAAAVRMDGAASGECGAGYWLKPTRGFEPCEAVFQLLKMESR
jgi:hypothetical protein